MTTIAYRDGVLCSDTLVTEDDARVGVVEKVWKTQAGILAGWAGSLNDGAAFRKWTEGGCDGKFKQGQEGDGIVVHPDGQLFFVDAGENGEAGLAPMQVAFTALGSGRKYALGAFACGVQAEQALMAAIAIDVNSGGKRIVVKLASREKMEAELKVQQEAAKLAAEGKGKKVKTGEVPPLQPQSPAQTAAQLTKTLANRKTRRTAAKIGKDKLPRTPKAPEAPQKPAA